MPPKRQGALTREAAQALKERIKGSHSNESGVDSGVDESGFSSHNDSEFSEDDEPSKITDNKIYFVLIRAHGGIPYNVNKTKLEERVPTFTVPEDMKVYKITSARNGVTNCGKYDYEEKKKDIKSTILDYEAKNKTTNVDTKQQKLAEKIQEILKTKEKGLFSNAEFRSIISEDKFINKQFRKYESEFTVQVIHIDEDEFRNYKKGEINKYFFTTEIYEKIIKHQTFDLKSVIEYLYNHNDILARRVILLDFSCSSFGDELSHPESVEYLDRYNLHGGKYKSSKNKSRRNKKTKTNKNKKTRKTKKL